MTLIKVCGITREADARVCADLGADWLGFIHHPASPRNAPPGLAASLAGLGPARVGVFVEQTADEVIQVMEAESLDLAQLHGDQDPGFCERVGPGRVIRCFWPARHPDTASLEAEMFRFEGVVAWCLVDAGIRGGGHGRSLDFATLAGVRAPAPLVLAGGLSPDNLAAALDTVDPAGVDLNSGVESAPGRKDADKVAQAAALVRARQT
jgi:phosphoribosylanthranilate isomerase